MSPSPIRLSLLHSALACALLALTSPTATAQCYGPDQLDLGGCCQPAFPNLPDFPGATLPALGVCWSACNVAGTQDLRMTWTPPSQVYCGEFVSQFNVLDSATGAALLTGTLVLDYTRTWLEFGPTGEPTQVWRFVAKVDLIGVAGGAVSPCVTPTCVNPVGPYETAFYYGYLDYMTCDPGAGWRNALVLFHNCDRFIHASGLSDKPGTFHPGRSYALVAPHSTLQPFVPMNAFATSGPLVAEATRNVDSVGPTSMCTVEDRVVAGDLFRLGAGCLCTISAHPKQQSVRLFKGQTACVNALGVPGNWTSVDLGFPAFPWLHMVSTSIGTWTNPNVYPGKEMVWVDEGVFAVQDACSGDFAEIKYGASTRGGWEVLLPIPVVVDDFTDLADNYTAKLFGPYPPPYVGSVQPTDHLVYVNVP